MVIRVMGLSWSFISSQHCELATAPLESAEKGGEGGGGGGGGGG